MIAGVQDQIHGEEHLHSCIIGFLGSLSSAQQKGWQLVCSSKDVITGVFWYDTSTEQVFLHLSLLLSIHAMQIHAHAPVGMSNKPLLVWSFCCCLLFCFFFKEGSSPCIRAQTQKGIRDTKKGARCWTYFLWADMYLRAGRSWDELSEVKCVVFCERIFFWKVKEKQRCVYGLIWTASCSWCHSIWI